MALSNLDGFWDRQRSKQKKKDMLRGFGISDEEAYNLEQQGFSGPFPTMEERFPAPEKRGLSEQTIYTAGQSGESLAFDDPSIAGESVSSSQTTGIRSSQGSGRGRAPTAQELAEMRGQAGEKISSFSRSGGGRGRGPNEFELAEMTGRAGESLAFDDPSIAGKKLNIAGEKVSSDSFDPTEVPSEEQLGMLGRNPALAGINQAQQDRQKSAMDAMDATEMQAAEAGQQKSAEVAAQQMDDAGLMNTGRQEPKQPDNPASAELAQLNAEAVSKNPAKKAKAQKEREGLFAGLSKEERAFAKEELGNYYVDPLSGHAVNLDAMAASDKRAAQVALLQYVPEHQRTTMMGKFGWLDAEDVKGLPEDPQVRVAEIQATTELAKQDMIESGASTRQTEQLDYKYKSLGDNTKLENRKLDILAENNVKDRELKKYGIDKQFIIDNDANSIRERINKANNALQWDIAQEGFNIDRDKAEILRDNNIREFEFRELKLSSDDFNAMSARQLQEKLATMNDATQWKIADAGFKIDNKKADILREMGVREWDFAELNLSAQQFNNMEDRKLRKHIAEKGFALDERRINNEFTIQSGNLELRNKLGIGELEYKNLALQVNKDIANGQMDLEVTLKNMGLNFNREQLKQAQTQFDKNLDFQYKQLSDKTNYENNMLKLQTDEQKLKYESLSTKQKQAYVLAEKAQDMAMFKALMAEGQPEMAFMFSSVLDLDQAFLDVDSYWKSQGKPNAMDSNMKAAIKLAEGFKGETDPKALRDGMKRYLNAKRKAWDKVTSTKGADEDESALQQWMRKNNIPKFDQLEEGSSESSDPRIGFFGGKRAGYETKVKSAMLNDLMRKDEMWGATHVAMRRSSMPKIDPPAAGADTGDDTGATTETEQPPPAVDTSKVETQIKGVEGTGDQEVEEVLLGAGNLEEKLKISAEGLEGDQKAEYEGLVNEVNRKIAEAAKPRRGKQAGAELFAWMKGTIQKLKMLSRQAQERRKARLQNR